MHVGKRGNLTSELAPFNDYLTRVMQWMRSGKTYSDVAVYLPLEDIWIAGELPEELQMPWSGGAYELRYEYFPDELQGFHPLWVNADFLEKGQVKKGNLHINGLTFGMLYADARYLDLRTLEIFYELARQGLPIVLKTSPQQAGLQKSPKFGTLLQELMAIDHVATDIPPTYKERKLLLGNDLPDYWCRRLEDTLCIFFANPRSKKLRYPLSYGQLYQYETIQENVTVTFEGHSLPLILAFEPYQSLLLVLDNKGNHHVEDIRFVPKMPLIGMEDSGRRDEGG